MVVAETLERPKRVMGCFQFLNLLMSRKRTESMDYLYREEKHMGMSRESFRMLDNYAGFYNYWDWGRSR